MKTILCFGDSNTWGYIPGTEGERFGPDQRWPGVMSAALGEQFRVVEEAQNGRTTVFDDPYEEIDKNGAHHLPVVLESQKPIDLVIIMLGTNDLKTHLGQSAASIAHGAATLAERVRSSDAGVGGAAPQVLLVSPVAVAEETCPFGELFAGAAEVSRRFPAAFQAQAESRNLLWFDAASVASCPDTDCIHLDAQGQRNLGEALAGVVGELLN